MRRQNHKNTVEYNYMKIKKGKSRVKTAVLCVIATICLGGIIISGYNLVQWLADSNYTKEQEGEIGTAAAVTEQDDSNKTETLSQDSNKNSLYWKYLKTKLIDVDFSELRSINPETVGWIQVGGTNINYPFVQTTNNDYYLTHSFNRSKNSAGWVFADFRNKLDGTDKNLIIYAHGRYDGTMFGTLRKALTNGWLSNTDNFIIRTSTEKENALWQVFSAYRIPTTSDYIRAGFTSDDDFNSFANVLMSRSAHNFNTTVSGSDHILTLSTCYSSTERMVIHAKLIKRLQK